LELSEPTAPGAGDLFSVADRRVLITGAAHGLGLGMATAFVGASARVALLDRDQAGLSAAMSVMPAGAAAHPVVGDVSDDEQVGAAVTTAVAGLGGLDAVINGAAIYPTAALADADSAHLREVLDVNVTGYARVVRAALPALRESGHGRIVNFGSITFFLGYPAGLGAYLASKGAVIGLTRALARELGPAGITVNTIAPGAFPTRAELAAGNPDGYTEQILDSQCLKRRGTVADIACAALFLVSDAASFITGQTLVVDGGWVLN
jgi:NAD(P)-dependent dehydrogenase (short-subunit alcohol dehydrogenase family)